MTTRGRRPRPLSVIQRDRCGGMARGPSCGGGSGGAAWYGRALDRKHFFVEYCANVTGAATLEAVWHRRWASATANPARCFSLPARQSPFASSECPVLRSALLRAATSAVPFPKRVLPSLRHKPRCLHAYCKRFQPMMTLTTIGRSPT